VDPPEAICRIEAHECRWAAGIPDVTPPMDPPHPGPSAAEQACREAEHDCVESRRVHFPHCSPVPPECTP
jgi:hypothetical protein